jgi:hypothetical protein
VGLRWSDHYCHSETSKNKDYIIYFPILGLHRHYLVMAYGLWLQNPRKLTREIQKCMVLLGSMGYIYSI